MNFDSIKANLAKFEEVRKDAEAVRAKITNDARNVFYETVDPGDKFKSDLMAALEPSIHRYLNHRTECSCHRLRYPDEIELTADGISVRFDADHPNDIMDYEISFEELTENPKNPRQ